MSGFARRILFSKFLLVTLFGLFAINQTAQAVSFNDKPYIDLNEVAKSFGMKSYWIEKHQKLRLTSKWTTIDFELHKREIYLNQIKLFLGDPIALSKGRLFMSEADLDLLLRPVLTPQVFTPPNRLRRIVIDPGHGGKDPGTQNEAVKLIEKSLVLDLSRRVEKSLKELGYEVYLTRTNDQFLDLAQRAQMANDWKADLFLSIHFNATTNPEVHGVETYIFTPQNQPSTARSRLLNNDQIAYPGNLNDPWNALIGYYIHRNLIETTRSEDRGLKRARFTVLRDLKMPGVLIEGGFVSHPYEGRQIGSAAYRDSLAEAIVNGVRTYDRTLNRLVP